MADRKAYVEKYRQKGMDVSGFTDAVMNDSGKFWELVKKLQTAYEQIEKEKYMKEKDEKRALEEKKYLEAKESKKIAETTKTTTDTAETKEKKMTTKAQDRPALSEKARKALQDRLDKIPEEKRATLLPRMLKNAEAQLAKAEEKGSKLLIRKLEAIVEIIKEEMESDDDDSLLDSIFEE